MIEHIRTWLTALVAVSILISVVQSMIPAGNLRKIASLTGGLLLLIVMIQPLARLDISHFSFDREDYEEKIEQRSNELETDSRKKMKKLIEKKTAAYISEQADNLGISCSVKVTTQVGKDGIPRPVAVSLSCAPSEKLATYIENELGIPRGRQTWNDKKNN